jgi:hypothetical protein
MFHAAYRSRSAQERGNRKPDRERPVAYEYKENDRCRRTRARRGLDRAAPYRCHHADNPRRIRRPRRWLAKAF